MSEQRPYLWKKMPFVRLIIPLMVGIGLQWYLNFTLLQVGSVAAVCLILLIVHSRLSLTSRYTYRWVSGFAFNILFAALGAFITYSQDIRNNKDWVGHHYKDSVAVLVTLNEPLVEKAKSYKAEATIEAIQLNGEWKNVDGKLLIYLSKDSSGKPALDYGSQLLLKKPLQPIQNSGNPGAFNYSQYNAFQDIYHQVFLKSSEYVIAATINENAFQRWLYNVRSAVIGVLRKYINGEQEKGVAEALLIGYRDDLDKDLVQAYSNTGVVHIIAISGLHLGMIYGALVFFFSRFKRRRWIGWVRPLVILGVLWIFSLLAGGVPSILRSAVMFTFIVIGETLNKKSSIYNTLASSAFVMLCINPFYLWDIGFQLSYTAVLSIVTFSRPVYNWFYVKNKALDFFWKLTSVTLSAQILTTPVIIYSFHQFPNYFLITNCLIVPLSSIILFAELLLLIVSRISIIAQVVGYITSFMLSVMNGFIQEVNKFPYAVYDGIQNNIMETIILYVLVISLCYFLMYKHKTALFVALTSLLAFAVVDAVEVLQLRNATRVIVYNVPKNRAIDFVAGREYSFIGDSTMLEDGYLRNFHLKPSRTLYRMNQADKLNEMYVSLPFIQFYGKRILLLDKPYKFNSPAKIPLDLIVISHNPKLYISDVANTFDAKQYVIDGSNSMWKINRWKRDCDSLHLRCHVTAEQGAYIMEF